jgi:hypothetical protein
VLRRPESQNALTIRYRDRDIKPGVQGKKKRPGSLVIVPSWLPGRHPVLGGDGIFPKKFSQVEIFLKMHRVMSNAARKRSCRQNHQPMEATYGIHAYERYDRQV